MSYKIKLSKTPTNVNNDNQVIGKIMSGEHQGKFINIVKDHIDEDGLNISLVDEWLDFIDYNHNIPISNKEIKDISYYLAKDEKPSDSNKRLKEIYDMFIEYNKKENKINIKGNEIELIPSMEPNQVSNLYIVGRSGSGKSTFIGKYIEKFLNLFGKNSPIFLFSSKPIDSEPAYQPFIDNIQQIFLTKDILEEYVNDDSGISPYEHFINSNGKSICIFDDTENLSPKIESLIKSLQSNILKTGRSSGIYTVNCRHILNSGSKTKDIWVESDKIVLFPMGIPRIHIEYGLTKYLGFSKKQIEELLNTKSRWVCINNRIPTYIIDSHRAYLPFIN